MINIKTNRITKITSRRMNKKGQFFLIAALVMVVIILGLASVSVSTKISGQNVRIFDLTNEIDLEGKSVVDQGIFEGKNPQANVDQLMLYYGEANPDSEITFVYGDGNTYDVKIARAISSGGAGLTDWNDDIETINLETIKENVPYTDGSLANVDVKLGEATATEPAQTRTFNFELGTGQNFYIVIVNTAESQETTVDTNAQLDTTSDGTTGTTKPLNP